MDQPYEKQNASTEKKRIGRPRQTEFENFVMTTIRLSPELLARARSVGRKHDVKMSQMIRRGLRREIEEMEKKG